MALLLLRNSAITPSVRLGLPIRASLRERTSSSSLSTLFSTRARAARVTGVPFSSATVDLVVPAGPVLNAFGVVVLRTRLGLLGITSLARASRTLDADQQAMAVRRRIGFQRSSIYT